MTEWILFSVLDFRIRIKQSNRFLLKTLSRSCQVHLRSLVKSGRSSVAKVNTLGSERPANVDSVQFHSPPSTLILRDHSVRPPNLSSTSKIHHERSMVVNRCFSKVLGSLKISEQSNQDKRMLDSERLSRPHKCKVK